MTTKMAAKTAPAPAPAGYTAAHEMKIVPLPTASHKSSGSYASILTYGPLTPTASTPTTVNDTTPSAFAIRPFQPDTSKEFKAVYEPQSQPPPTDDACDGVVVLYLFGFGQRVVEDSLMPSRH